MRCGVSETKCRNPLVKEAIATSSGFTSDSKEQILERASRILGGLEGKVTVPDDFDEPLEDLKEYM